MKRHCPEGLFLDPTTKSCEQRAQIPMCNGFPRPSNANQQSQQSSQPSKIVGGSKQTTIPGRGQQQKPTTSVHRRLPLVLPTYAQFYPEKFCTELPDGFYRHPTNCSRILQVFFITY